MQRSLTVLIAGAAKGTEYRLKLPLVVTEKPQGAVMTPEMTSGRGIDSSEMDEQQRKHMLV